MLKAIENRIMSFVGFKHLWVFLPTLLVFLYGVQGVVGVMTYKSPAASQFVGIFALGILVYLLTFFSLRAFQPGLPWLERLTGKYRLPVDWWIRAISLTYFLLVIYAVASSEKIAVWEALNGASASDIAYARETLFKARTGWEQSLIYMNALFSSALMPYVLVVCYLEKKNYRHLLLLLFVVSLLPSLEKSLAIKAFLPLIIAAFSGYLSRRSGYLFIFLMLAVIMGTTQLSRMGQADTSQLKLQITGVELAKMIQQAQQAQQTLLSRPGLSPEERARLLEKARISLEKLHAEQAFQARFEAKYRPLGSANQWAFLLNRILWIPYITAHDWLGYFHEKMDDEYLYGRTSLVVSKFTGRSQFPMEKEVFIYQFGVSGPPTAAANATFLVDAFVNFSWFGVALFSALFAVLTRLIDWSDNPAAKACYYYFTYQVAVGGLFGVLFSNGLLAFVVLALFMRPKTVCNGGPPGRHLLPKGAPDKCEQTTPPTPRLPL